MMNAIWAAMMFAGLVFGMINGHSAQLEDAAMAAARDAVGLAIRMAGGFALFSGMLAIVEDSGAIRALTRGMSPLLGRLFPGLPKDSKAREAMAANMAANMIGLGNAATPMGLMSMRLLAEGEGPSDSASDTMCMFLVINACSLQLFPSTVIAMRAAAGSGSPGAVVLPALIATGASAIVGVSMCWMLARASRARHA